MPRRRSTKGKAGKSKARVLDHTDSKIKKWNTIADIPLDEEDQFHHSRDKVPLDGAGYANDDDDGDEDEVFALKGVDNDSNDSQGEDFNQDPDEDEDDDDEESAPSPKESSRAVKSKKKKKTVQSSSESSESESEEETWGQGKSAYYASNAAEIESDDEEANELEEQEARRLQAKAREGMCDDDFGLNDIHDVGDDELNHNLDDITPLAVPALPQDKKQLLRHLEKTNPEALALARDWEDTAWNVVKTKAKLERLQANEPDALSLGMIHLHYQSLLTYASTLAFYLHLRSSQKYAQRPELLRSHPIMTRLLTLKRGLSMLEDLEFTLSDSDDDSEGDGDSEDERNFIWGLDRAGNLEDDELEQLLNDAMLPPEPPTPIPPSPEVLVATQPPKKKRKKNSTSSSTLAHIFDLVEPEFESSRTTSSRRPDASGITDTYGEAPALEHGDAADKSARKKSLRFHTSKIESASARRQGARNQAVGGDDDIPYRERKKSRDARLAKEAKARGLGQGGEDLDDVEPPPPKAGELPGDRDVAADSGGSSDADEYYELVQKKAKEKKEKKKAEYEATTAAARLDAEGDTVMDGPRAPTRAILANKGLTPQRSKSVRNPRVKKRQKFEKAKKKLSSQKAVYKGGLADSGHYSGEKTGISKVVKSIWL